MILNLQLPEWQETLESARARYVEVVKALADKYPSENLLLVTHGKSSCLVLQSLVQCRL